MNAPNGVPDWDAGDLGCGELVMLLRMRLLPLAPGALFTLRATDPAAPEDIPAWCRLTRHALVSAEHPIYIIKRREN
ncbi:MAG TPA: sulfurtransferase TusA family protein [Gemmata sp.]